MVLHWQPIETAPKDGTIVLLGGGTWGDDWLDDAPRVMAARWIVGYRRGQIEWSGWMVCVAEAGYSRFPYENPTHWMPSPSFPG